MVRRWRSGGFAAVTMLLCISHAAAQPSQPARAAFEGCKWERLEDSEAGLTAWAQQCDFGARKTQVFFSGSALVMQYSDGGAPNPLIEIFDRRPGETPKAAMQRIFAEKTKPDLVKRCVLVPYRDGPSPKGAQRFTFVPNAAYGKELARKADPNEVGDPPCGDWGTAPDGIQYFQIWPKSRSSKLAFVRVGQEEPMFDELSLVPIEPSP
ncbi:MAG: hypothetical protein JWN11_360 [Hyphomicrobiales bacterium]|nr:hypothetical protein [Hyphomicrobiales bacterium]